MSTKILPSVSDEEFNKAMNYGDKKNKSSVNSILNNKEDIKISNLNIDNLTKMKNSSNNILNKNEKEPLNNQIKNTVKTTRNKIKKTQENIKDKSSGTLDKLINRIKENPTEKKERLMKKEIKKAEKKQERQRLKEDGKSIIGPIIKTLLIVLVILMLSYAVYYYFNNILNDTTKGINLIEGVIDGKQPLVISQDQSNPNYIPINKSFGQEGGAEFTYSFWFAINDMEYRKGEWKDIFYKGDKYKYNQCPGVFIHQNTNKIRINMNVIKQKARNQEDTIDFVDIDNIPIGSWINLVMVFTENKKSINPNNENKIYKNCLDIYINGLLKTRKELSSVPLFNTHPVWINMNGGFDGVLGNLEYFPRALETIEIHKILKKCPGESQCGKKLDCPPYLSNNWWFN